MRQVKEKGTKLAIDCRNLQEKSLVFLAQKKKTICIINTGLCIKLLHWHPYQINQVHKFCDKDREVRLDFTKR
jgi:hypothetical protein